MPQTQAASGPAGTGPATMPESRPAGLARLPERAEAFWTAHCTDRGRLAAERAARADALLRMADLIRQVPAGQGATLKDLVARGDDPNVDLRSFLRGARPSGVRYFDDVLAVEVRLEIRLRTVQGALRSWAMGHYKGDREALRNLEGQIIRGEDTVLWQSGFGTPPEAELKDADPELRRAMALAAILRAAGGGTQPATQPATMAATQPAVGPDTQPATGPASRPSTRPAASP